MLVIGRNKKEVSRILKWVFFFLFFFFFLIGQRLGQYCVPLFSVACPFLQFRKNVLSLVFLLESHLNSVTNLHLGSYLC